MQRIRVDRGHTRCPLRCRDGRVYDSRSRTRSDCPWCVGYSPDPGPSSPAMPASVERRLLLRAVTADGNRHELWNDPTDLDAANVAVRQLVEGRESIGTRLRRGVAGLLEWYAGILTRHADRIRGDLPEPLPAGTIAVQVCRMGGPTPEHGASVVYGTRVQPKVAA